MLARRARGGPPRARCFRAQRPIESAAERKGASVGPEGRTERSRQCYPDPMVSLLTFAVYGTWLAGPARGRIERTQSLDLPEPDGALSARRRRGLKWPAVSLDHRRRAVVLADLHRIAALRGFALLAAVVAADHVHVLLAVDPRKGTQDAARLIGLVQLIKGALSRRLSVGEGDPPPRSATGETLAHHKWWSRQYALLPIEDQATLDRVHAQLVAHEGEVATYFAQEPEGSRDEG